MQYDSIAVNTIVKNKNGEVSSGVRQHGIFNQEYLKYTFQAASGCRDRDLSAGSRGLALLQSQRQKSTVLSA